MVGAGVGFEPLVLVGGNALHQTIDAAPNQLGAFTKPPLRGHPRTPLVAALASVTKSFLLTSRLPDLRSTGGLGFKRRHLRGGVREGGGQQRLRFSGRFPLKPNRPTRGTALLGVFEGKLIKANRPLKLLAEPSSRVPGLNLLENGHFGV